MRPEIYDRFPMMVALQDGEEVTLTLRNGPDIDGTVEVWPSCVEQGIVVLRTGGTFGMATTLRHVHISDVLYTTRIVKES